MGSTLPKFFDECLQRNSALYVPQLSSAAGIWTAVGIQSWESGDGPHTCMSLCLKSCGGYETAIMG